MFSREMTRKADKLFALLQARSAEIIDATNLRTRLKERRNLRVKLGVDPTTPDLHLGHVVPLRVLRAFQDAGHEAILIIGDFTSQIGDPSGKNAARRQLTPAEVKANERFYRGQIGRILDPKKIEVRHNSEWFGRMRLAEFLGLCSRFSLKSAWEREDFQRRLARGGPVMLHEPMYSLLQAYDSVAVRADVELGGIDQKLNLLAGRELQAKLGRVSQDIVLLPYLLGLEGKQKMSKTAGNTINLRDTAEEMFGKVMSIPDDLIVNYAELAAWLPLGEIRNIRRRLARRENPRDVKSNVASAVVELYYGKRAVRRARERFMTLFSKRMPDASLPTVRLTRRVFSPLELITALRAAPSRSEARRLLKGGALEVDGRVIPPDERAVEVTRGSVVRVGKRKFFRIA